jgi:transmembrane sensor
MTEDNSHTDPSDPARPVDWDVLARHLAGEALPEERARVDAFLDQSPEDRELVDALDAVISTRGETLPHDLDVEGALRKVKARRDAADVVPSRPRTKWLVPMPALAAAALLAVGVASWMSYRNRPGQEAALPASRMLATGIGVRDSLELSDGTRVIIGPLSSVVIARDYGNESREVEVRGDAWFDVVHNEQKPFTVRAGNAVIVDVGTRFAVRSDASEGVSVSVSEGAVSLRPVNSPAPQGIVLRAGDNGLLNPGGQVTAGRGKASSDDTAWISGRLVFRDAAIGEVISSMRKWYGIEMRATDPSLAGRHLTATFASGESVDRVLEIIHLALGVEVERRGDTAIVRPARGSVR